MRCKWCNVNNPKYVEYHDTIWARCNHDDQSLFAFFALEIFQAGLSWECVLNKEEDLFEDFDDFDFEKVRKYKAEKVKQLLSNKKIIRHKLKIEAIITNAEIFKKIKNEYSSFDSYIWSFTKGKVVYVQDDNQDYITYLVQEITTDLSKKGLCFIGKSIIKSYLEAIGVINNHEKTCYLYKK